MSTPTVVSAGLSAAQAIPKSVSTARLSGLIRMFAGFTSRWTMPAACATRSAARICRPT